MDRRSKIVLFLFFGALLAIIVTEVVRPKPLDWSPSYTGSHTKPFGCYVLFNELENLFPNNVVKTAIQSPYEALDQIDTTQKSSYIFINNYLHFDVQESFKLLKYAEKGNTVFLAAGNVSGVLADTLNLDIESSYYIREDTIVSELTHQRFSGKKYPFNRGVYKSYIFSVDTANTKILGYNNYYLSDDLLGTKKEYYRRANFIETKFGKGKFLISTLPQAYSNYYLLKGNQEYALNSLFYLPDNTVYWDTYKKVGRAEINSPMRFVLNQKALKWAYYLAISGLLLFVIFRAKREQRIIPIIKPLENSSVDFSKTVGNLYYQNKDFTNLVNKKVNYFLEFVRSTYYVNTASLNENTIKQLASKSGKPLNETKQLIDFIIYLRKKKNHHEQDLITLNKKITAFKQ